MAKYIVNDAYQAEVAIRLINYFTHKSHRYTNEIVQKVINRYDSEHILSKDDWKDIFNFLEHGGFVEYHKNDDTMIKLTKHGQKLKELSDFKAFFKWKAEKEAKADNREKLGDVILEHHANIISWERKYKKAIQVITVSIALVALIISIYGTFFKDVDKDRIHLLQEQQKQLEMRLHQLEETKNIPLKTDVVLDSVSSYVKDTL